MNFLVTFTSIIRRLLRVMLWRLSNIFSGGALLKQWKAIFVTLNPKIDNPKLFKVFCPISLCNIFNMLIAKILVGRIKKFLPKLISEE